MARLKLSPRPELAALSPYNAGLSPSDLGDRCGAQPIAKMGSNENPRSLPPEVIGAMGATASKAHLYCDPATRELTALLAGRLGIASRRIIAGNGSEDLLSILSRAVLRPGDEVVTLYPSFPLHEDYARMMGAHVTRVDLTRDRRIDVEALLHAASRPARLTVIANPMNPAGLWLMPDALDALLDAQHDESVLCLDEAYVEYALGEDHLAGTERLAAHGKPLLILRTFSKAWGLAGLRIGYGLSNCDALIDAMNLVRTPFNVNAIAQAAAAAALRSDDYMRKGVSETVAERERLAATLPSLGVEALPSKGNFLFIDCGKPSTDIAERLMDRGIIIKPWKQAGYETFIRVSIGLPAENDRFLQALAEIIER